MLLTLADYQRLALNQPSIIELLSEPEGIEDIDLDVTTSRELPEPAGFD